MNFNPSPDLLQKNISLLRQVYPQYEAILAPFLQNESSYRIEEISPQTYTCRVSTPQEQDLWVHGPDDPWRKTEMEIQGSDWQTAQMFLVLRPSLGYMPLLLYPNLHKGRQAQRMLLVEDRLDLFVESLRRFDWTDLLRSDRIILIIVQKPVEEIYKFIQMNPVVILPPMQVFIGCNEGPEELALIKQLQPMLANLANTVNQAAQQYLSQVQKHYQQKDPASPKKILFMEPEHDYLADSIMSGFRGVGCLAEKFHANRRLLHFLNPYIWIVYLREHFPDILLWMNRNSLSTEGAEYIKQLPIKRVLWFLDSPKRVETSKEELEATDVYFSFDPSYLPYLKELSGREGYYLPTAAGIRPLPECEPEKSWPQRTGPMVGFMGALAAQRFQEVREFWLGRDSEFVMILDRIVEDYLADPSVPLEQRYEDSPGRERLPYSGFPVLYLEERSTYLRRLRFLRAVKSLGLKTYGAPEWGKLEWAQDLTPCYTGQAPRYQEELPAVYYHTHININVFHVQCINSTNPRIYDVLAAGGFLLTEYRPAIEEEFVLGQHLVCFHSPEDLREKADYYLAHADERENIARAGQAHVLETATYRNRAEAMLAILNRNVH